MASLAKSLPGDVDDDLSVALRGVAGELIAKLETELELSAKEGDDLIDRIRKVRRKIHSLRIMENPELADYKARTLAAEAMLAYRLLTYPGTYLEENPTLDRMGETIQKVLEDLRSDTLPPLAPRRAMVRFGEPIDLAKKLNGSKGRERISALTQCFETAVQDGLDLLNSNNDCVGAQPFQSLRK